MRLWARVIVANCLYYSRALAVMMWVRRRVLGRKEICVLALHRVLSEAQWAQATSLPGMVIKESSFAGLLEFLRRHFTVIPLEGLLQESPSLPDSAKPLCLITFDDGWKDNYTTAFPWLRRLELPAVVFLVTGMVGKRNGFWVERLVSAWRDPSKRGSVQAHLKTSLGAEIGHLHEAVEQLKHISAAARGQILAALGLDESSAGEAKGGNEMLDWPDILAMTQGGIEFAAHTDSHPLLVYEDDATVSRELRDGKTLLEEKLGAQVKAFAYPNGAWDERVRKMVEDEGYQCAFTTCRGWHRHGQERFDIPRIMLHEGRLTGLSGKFSPAILSFSLTGWR